MFARWWEAGNTVLARTAQRHCRHARMGAPARDREPAMMATVIRGVVLVRVVLVLVWALALTACRLDVQVDVTVGPDGTGVVTATAVADAELVAQVPDLAESLVFDDAIAAGWTVEGPSPTPEGGLTVTLTHPVASAEELANVLASIGPPFTDMRAGRTTENEQTTNAIAGTLVLANGFESFADADLLAAVGGLPFADEFTASGATPSSSMSVTMRAELPGELVSSTGTEVERDVFEWQAPLDGSSQEVRLETVQRSEGDTDTWAQPLATVLLLALVAWVVGSIAFVVWVLLARRARRRRRQRAVLRRSADR
jgi:hypothetical protein